MQHSSQKNSPSLQPQNECLCKAPCRTENTSIEIFKNHVDAILCHVLWDNPTWEVRLNQMTHCDLFQPDPSCDSGTTYGVSGASEVTSVGSDSVLRLVGSRMHWLPDERSGSHWVASVGTKKSAFSMCWFGLTTGQGRVSSQVNKSAAINFSVCGKSGHT